MTPLPGRDGPAWLLNGFVDLLSELLDVGSGDGHVVVPGRLNAELDTTPSIGTFAVTNKAHLYAVGTVAPFQPESP